MSKRLSPALPCFAAAALAAINFISCNNNNEEVGKLVTRAVTKGGLEVAVSAPGKVRPAKTVLVKSRAAGEIEEIKVDEGDTVRRGELLILLDPELERSRLLKAEAELRAAKAAVKQARIKHEQAVDDFKRTAELFEERMVSEAEYIEDKRRVELSEAELSAARSSKRSAVHAVEEARDRLSHTEIKAPMDGTVLDLAVSEGQVVSSATSGLDTGTLLMTLADTGNLLVLAEVDETDVAKVEAGQRARIELDAFPGLVLPARVLKVSPEAREQGAVTVVEVRVGIENRKGAELRPGMTASVEIVTASVEDALLLPVEALRERKGERGVVVMKDGSTEWRPVKTGPADWKMMSIEEGLSEGDSVVMPGEAVTGAGW